MRVTLSIFFVVILFFVQGCIGTDLVDEFIGPNLSKLELARKEISIILGQEASLVASFSDYNGDVTNAPLTWKSLNATIAQVDDAGKVTAKATGQTKIIVSTEYVTGTLSDTTLVTVVNDPTAVASVIITGNNNSLTVGATLQLSASARNAAGNAVLQYPITWQSANPTVATVNNNGLVTGVANGTTEITATANNIKSLPFQISIGTNERVGTFSGRRGYTVMGTGRVRKVNGTFIVSLDADFSASSGPGLHVYLSDSDATASAGVDLGDLKSRTGAQSYEVPTNIDANAFKYVLIYCKPFSVTFGAAEMK